MNKFYKNLQMELTAKINWEFTDKIKNNIWNNKYDNMVIASYKNGETYEDGTPMKFGWQLEVCYGGCFQRRCGKAPDRSDGVSPQFGIVTRVPLGKSYVYSRHNR